MRIRTLIERLSNSTAKLLEVSQRKHFRVLMSSIIVFISIITRRRLAKVLIPKNQPPNWIINARILQIRPTTRRGQVCFSDVLSGNRNKIIFFLSKIGHKGKDCISHRTQSLVFDYFKLDSLKDVRPTGFKVKLQLSVLANKSAVIILDSAGKHLTSPNYLISTGHLVIATIR